MALVTSFESSPKERQTVHGLTRCLYAIVETPTGDRYLQLDTVGSEDRAIPDKVSQSIQFDRQAAGQPLQLLQRTFPDLMSSSKSAFGEDEAADPEDEATEGRVRLSLHRRRERNPKIVRKKKQSVLRAIGRLNCEVCQFDFATVYGPVGEGFAECHHRVPLAELDGATSTRLVDLAIVCANCHRVLHRPPIYTVEQLREIVQTRRTGVPST